MRRLAFALPLVLAACLARTEAEDPLAGSTLEGGVVATADGAAREVRLSVLVAGETFPAGLFREASLERWLAEEVRLPSAANPRFELAWPTHGAAATGELLEHDPDRRLLVRLDPFAGAPETRLRLTAEEAPGGVRVRLEQGPFPADASGRAAADRHRRAWAKALAVLRSERERGLPSTPAPPPGA